MKGYRKPGLVSYKASDITEIIGPGQAQSATLDVGGGWEEKGMTMEYKIGGISPEARLVKADIKDIDETIA